MSENIELSFRFAIRLIFNMFLACTGREERQVAVWSCSSKLLVFLQHLVAYYVFAGSVVFSF